MGHRAGGAGKDLARRRDDAETNDWFVYQFATAQAASIVFNDGAGRQTGNLWRDRLGWFCVSDPTPPLPDGTLPNASTVRYTGPVAVSQSLTIRAVGVNSEGEVGQARTFTDTMDPDADLEQPTITWLT